MSYPAQDQSVDKCPTLLPVSYLNLVMAGMKHEFSSLPGHLGH